MELYNYKAVLKKVVDGDTIIVDIDLGLSFVRSDTKIRMARINTPELSNPATEKLAIDSKSFLEKLIKNKEIVIKIFGNKQDKYGRYLGEIFVESNDDWTNINDKMLENGKAVLYKGFLGEEFIY